MAHDNLIGGSPPRPYKRRSSLPKKGLQLRTTARIAGFVGLLVLFMFISEFQALRSVLSFGGSGMDPTTIQETAFGGFALRYLLFLSSVAFFVIVTMHFIAGPIYRIEKACRAVAAGDLTHRVHLRRFDELKDLRAEFDAMTEALRRTVLEERAALQELATRAESLAAREDLPPDVRDELNNLRAALGGILQRFIV